MPVLVWDGWLIRGSFDQFGVWHFDKDVIARELKTGIEENRLCPVLDPEKIMATLERIPDIVDPNSDPNWEYATNYEVTEEGDFREVPKGVRPVLKAAASYIAGDYQPEWESPEQKDFGFRSQMPLLEESKKGDRVSVWSSQPAYLPSFSCAKENP